VDVAARRLSLTERSPAWEHPCVRLGGVVSIVLLLAARAGAELSVSTCGAVVPAGETATLTGDLDCGGASAGVTLGAGTTLAMNGFSIRHSVGSAIDCIDGACTVVGGTGSEIADCTGDGIVVSSPLRRIRRGLTVSDVRIHDCSVSGIEAPLAGVDATYVEVTGNGLHGVHAWRVRATGLVASGNAFHGIQVRSKIVATGVTADANGVNGINGLEGRARVTGASIHDNVHAGIAVRRLRLESSTVTDNNAGASGIDLFIGRRPSVRDTVCGVSQQIIVTETQILIGPTWGVCAND
jgi:hypothetical protein